MNDTAPNVIIIPAKVETPQEQEKKRHLRVAAYCRVSTDSEEQLSSYENQLSYLEDDRLEFSNNRAERSIKPFVMGRKDFLFCDTPGGPRSSAVLYSLIETAKETGLGPYRYTQDFIRFHAGGLSGSSRIMIGRKSMIE